MLINDGSILNLIPVNYRAKLHGIAGLWNKGKSFFITPVFVKGKSIPIEITNEYNLFRPLGPQKQVCYVSASNISFSQNGKILSCNYNQQIVLGNYPDQSIMDAWKNNTLKKLQEAISINDLSMGCSYCANFFHSKKFSGLKPLVYDKYAGKINRNYPQVMEFELSNTCNLECIMCNGSASSMIRKNKENLPPVENVYDDLFIEQLKEFIPHLKEAKFYGGEPFLIDIYYKIWDAIFVINPKIKIFIITNGTVLNQRIKDLLNKGNFELGVSIDSVNKTNFERIRKNADFEKVFDNLNWFNNYCKSRGTVLSVSVTLSRENWNEVPDIIEFCNNIKAQIFFSYLQKPEKLALWNLSSSELTKILDEITKNTLKTDNAVDKQETPFDYAQDDSHSERSRTIIKKIKLQYYNAISKYNSSCFDDFINHLEYWKEKNSTQNPQIINNFKEYFTNSLIQHFSLTPQPEHSAYEITKQLDDLFIQSGNIFNEENLYSELIKIPLDSIIFQLKEKQEMLKEQAKKWMESLESGNQYSVFGN